MKQKLFHILFFICVTLTLTQARDSAFVFKISLGVNYNHLRFESDYNHITFSHFSYNSKSLRVKDSSSYSLILKVGVEKMISKSAGLGINISYNFSKLNYSTYGESSYSSPPAFNGYSKSIITDYSIVSHHISASFGPVFHIKHFYVNPKINLASLVYVNRTDQTITVNDSAGTTATMTSTNMMDDEFIVGGGLIIGYDFRIKKIPLFIELQGDYYNRSCHFLRNGLNASLAIGIKL